MRAALSPRGATLLWIMLLTAASSVTTLALACATPFPALAALAAVHMRVRDGVSLMLVAWAASQVMGFYVLGYPHDAGTVGWAVALGTAAVGSLWRAQAALGQMEGRAITLRLAIAYAAAFVAFKLVILSWALGLGGVASTIDPVILARQFMRNGAILIGLFGLYHGLVALGMPAAGRRVAVA